MRRFIAIFLCATLLCCALPTGLLAGNDVIASGKAGDNIRWRLDTEGHLILSGNGETYNFAYYDYPVPWKDYRTDIKTVTIGEGITTLHQNTFYGCSNMTEITLPSTLTDITGNVTFYGCNNLKKVHISDLDAWCRMNFGLVQHQEQASPLFGGATLLLNGEEITEITVPDGVTTIWSYQYSIPTLKKLILPDSIETVAAYSLKNTKNTEIHISDLEEWLEIDFRLFQSGPLDKATLYIDGEPLTSLTVPDGITEIKKSAFNGYDKLTYLDFNDVTSVGEYAFYGCKGLEVANLSDVESLDFECFNQCESLKEVYVSHSITSMDSNAFGWNDIVEKIHIADLYEYCTDQHYYQNLYNNEDCGVYLNGELITHLDVPLGIDIYNTNAFTGYNRLESVSVPEGVTEIGTGAFSSCDNLTSVSLPQTLTAIGERAFSSTGLVDIDIPDNVSIISKEAFVYCDELSHVSLPKGCTTISEGAFYICNITGQLILPDGLTHIYDYAFCGNRITEVTIPNSVVYIAPDAFESNEGMVILCYLGSYADNYAKENNIPVKYITQSKSASVKTPPNKTVYALNEELDLTGLVFEVELDDGTKQLVDTGFTVGEYDFTTPGKKNISINVMGQSVDVTVEVLLKGQCGENAFWSISDGVFTLSGSGVSEVDIWNIPWEPYRDLVTKIDIADGITTIGYRFFKGFTNVTEVVIPASIEKIEGSAFEDCSSLTDVTFAGSPETVEEWAFERCVAAKNVHVKSLEDWFNIGFYNATSNPLYYAGNLYVDGHRLSNVTVPDGVTKIYPCAFDFDFLKKVTIPEGVTEIGIYAFRGCEELTSVRMPLSVTTIHRDAFEYCSKDVKIYCPAGAYAAEYAYENEIDYEYTDKVKEVNIATLPHKTDYSVYDVVDFSGLTLEVIFENGVVITTDHNYRVEEYVLDYTGEKEITLYYKEKSVILTVNVGMGDVLAQGYCGVGVNWILYENGYLNIYGEGMMEETPWLTYADTVKTVVIEEGVTTICEEAFKNCRNISAIHIPTSMETVKYSVFEGVPKIDKMYITSLTAYCNIYFEHVLSTPLSRGAALIVNGEEITDLVIPEGVTYIGDNQFYDAEFNSVTLPSTLISIGNSAFSCMDGLTSIHIPDSVTDITHFAFYSCYNLKEVTGGKGVVHVGMSAFGGTPFIEQKEVYVGDMLIHVDPSVKGIYSVDYGTKIIGIECFAKCDNITLIIVPNTVTEISWAAFNNCTKLKEVMIPESVTSIDITAFDKPYTTVIRCKEGSYAAEFAQMFGIPYEYYESKVFSDVKENAWYADAVTYCTERGYISGMSDNSFAPNNNLTREQFVMILSQVAGVDTEQYKELDDGFADTKSGMWYSGAVYWAVSEGYVSGVAADRFGLGQNITREQLARLFYLYAESVGMDVTSRADLSKFADSSKISSWASDQIKWAVAVGLISGMSETSLSPRGTATRAQAARIFMLFDRIN